MKIIVLGGTGFVGHRVVASALARGDSVLAVHRGTTESPAGCEDLLVERSEFASVADRVAAFGPDAVVDAYALTRADAQAVLPHLPEVPLVVLSSVDVYQAYDSLRAGVASQAVPFDETAPVRSVRFPYRNERPEMHDYDKLDVEEEYLGRGGTVLRLPIIYGERDRQRREEFLLRRIRAGRPALPIGSGSWLVSRCYSGDIATAALAAADPRLPGGEIFNVAEPRTTTIEGWARDIVRVLGVDVDLVRVADEDVPDDLEITRAASQHLLVDSAKAREILGWNVSPSDDTVTASVRWHLDHPPENEDPDFSADDAALARARRD